MGENVIARMVQVGIVTAVDSAEHKCRVKFPDTGLTSDWLRVLRQTPGVSVNDGGAHSHTGSASVSGGDHSHSTSVTINVADAHSHGAGVSAWMPRINDTVVVLYIPVFNSDGFVIGVV
jgi:hypothetical protein